MAATPGWRRAALHPPCFSVAAVQVVDSVNRDTLGGKMTPPPQQCPYHHRSHAQPFFPSLSRLLLPPLLALDAKGDAELGKYTARKWTELSTSKKGTSEPKIPCEKPHHCQPKYSKLDLKGKRDLLLREESYTRDVAGKEEAA